MFPRGYFAVSYFAPTYFAPVEVVIVTTPNVGVFIFFYVG